MIGDEQFDLNVESISLNGMTGVQVAWSSASNRLYSV
jgi:hypothetical protein